jgi:hypothetical protein
MLKTPFVAPHQGQVNCHVFALNPIHLNPISNPTPLRTDPNWLGHLMHPNGQGSRVNPSDRGKNERRHLLRRLTQHTARQQS